MTGDDLQNIGQLIETEALSPEQQAMVDRHMQLREKVRTAMAEEYISLGNSELLSLMTEEDRKAARSVYDHKQHLGTLGMIELAYMMGKSGGVIGRPRAET